MMDWLLNVDDPLTLFANIVGNSPNVSPEKYGIELRVADGRLDALCKCNPPYWTILVSRGRVLAYGTSANNQTLQCATDNDPWLLIDKQTGLSTYACGLLLEDAERYFSYFPPTYYSLDEVFAYKKNVRRQPTELSKTLYIQDVINFLYIHKNAFDVVDIPSADNTVKRSAALSTQSSTHRYVMQPGDGRVVTFKRYHCYNDVLHRRERQSRTRHSSREHAPQALLSKTFTRPVALQ